MPFSILLPAFVTSELKTAFQIGFLIFLPFLIIDLVVSSTLMSLGMMMLSPTIVSMPFKLLLFVMVDGWALTMGSLAASFAEASEMDGDYFIGVAQQALWILALASRADPDPGAGRRPASSACSRRRPRSTSRP